jgi:hypothetical protein
MSIAIYMSARPVYRQARRQLLKMVRLLSEVHTGSTFFLLFGALPGNKQFSLDLTRTAGYKEVTAIGGGST